MTNGNTFVNAARNGMKKPANVLLEFKTFMTKGNVIQLAIAVVLGAQFNAIVTSVVNNIFNPIIGLVGSNNLENLYVPIRNYNGITYSSPKEANEHKIITLNIGAVISSIITFVLVSFFCFVVTKLLIDSINKQKKEEPTKGPCVYCKEEIFLEAVICPHCHYKNPIEGVYMQVQQDERIDLTNSHSDVSLQ